MKQYGLGWKFKAGNVVKEEWDNSRSVNYISMHIELVFDIRRCNRENGDGVGMHLLFALDGRKGSMRKMNFP